MESYEIVIIGSGPGGLICAQKLSEAGRSVLLLEQNSEIGPKVCAGGLTGYAIQYFKLPRELFDFEFKEIIAHTPLQNRTIDLKEPFTNTIDRKNLGQWQLRNLKKTSAKIRVNAKVIKIHQDHVIINNSEKIYFKYLDGADGSNSITRKYVGLKTGKRLIAIQYLVPGDAFKKFEMFFDQKLFSLGYAWIFPHKGYSSVGCGCEPSVFSSKDLMEGFNKWLKEKKIDVSKSKYEAFTINYDYQGFRFGNIFLVGDAAGLASGLTGGGIFQAMVSGVEVAKSIINNKYISHEMEELIKNNEKQNRTLRFMANTKSIVGLELELFVLLTRSDFVSKYLLGAVM
jgi:geranylgeranyl reductase